MGSGFVGLDVERCQDLARVAERTAVTVGGVSDEVARWLWLGDLNDVGAVARCTALVDELDLLGRLLSVTATEMAAAEAGFHVDVGALDVAQALWASLIDGTGAGVDFDPDPGITGAITMSATTAADTLARHLTARSDDDWSAQDIYDLAADDTVSLDVRAAAMFASRNPDAFTTMFGGATITAASLAAFASESAALTTLAKGWARFTGVGGRPDGELSAAELYAAVNDTTARFSTIERDAARWLLEHDRIDAPWKRFDTWTQALVNRQILAAYPDLAVSWLYLAAADPGRVVTQDTWFDQPGADAWLNTALASATDPDTQADLIVQFATICQATKPDPATQVVHDLLDGISFIDPTQLADATNTAIYTAEGDYTNAAISAAGMAIIFGGGKMIRLTTEQLAQLTAGHADEVIEAAVVRLAREGELTDDIIKQAVTDVAEQFDDVTARRVRTALQHVASDGGAWLDDDVLARVPREWGLGGANDSGVGTRWFDPVNEGNGIRIDRGDMSNPLPTQQVDHVIVRYEGRVIGRDGQAIVGRIADNHFAAHVPLSEWVTWKTWYAP